MKHAKRKAWRLVILAVYAPDATKAELSGATAAFVAETSLPGMGPMDRCPSPMMLCRQRWSSHRMLARHLPSCAAISRSLHPWT
jgi:hypothetical protein